MKKVFSRSKGVPSSKSDLSASERPGSREEDSSEGLSGTYIPERRDRPIGTANKISAFSLENDESDLNTMLSPELAHLFRPSAQAFDPSVQRTMVIASPEEVQVPARPKRGSMKAVSRSATVSAIDNPKSFLESKASRTNLNDKAASKKRPAKPKIEQVWKITFHKYDWKKNGRFYYKDLKPGDSDYVRFINFFESYLHGAGLPVSSIQQIYNPGLIASFNHHKTVMANRKEGPDAHLYNKMTYLSDSRKLWVAEQYQNRAADFPWNVDEELPILPVLHGTDGDVALKICQTGFSTLSSLDCGYYGQGMYFSTNAKYTLPYFAAKRKPTIILCFVIPGNIFPVTEDTALSGCPITPGYQSHYVMTNRNGRISETNVGCDEIVIGQESQVVPAYILSFEQRDIFDEAKNWQREVLEEIQKTTLILEASISEDVASDEHLSPSQQRTKDLKKPRCGSSPSPFRTDSSSGAEETKTRTLSSSEDRSPPPPVNREPQPPARNSGEFARDNIVIMRPNLKTSQQRRSAPMAKRSMSDEGRFPRPPNNHDILGEILAGDHSEEPFNESRTHSNSSGNIIPLEKSDLESSIPKTQSPSKPLQPISSPSSPMAAPQEPFPAPIVTVPSPVTPPASETTPSSSSSYTELPVNSWTAVHVSQWAKDCNFPTLVDSFLASNVDGIELLNLQQNDLKALVPTVTVGLRTKVFKERQNAVQKYGGCAEFDFSKFRFSSMPVENWTVEDTAECLSVHGLSRISAKFAEDKIDGIAFEMISDEEWNCRYEVNSHGDQQKLLRIRSKIQHRPFPEPDFMERDIHEWNTQNVQMILNLYGLSAFADLFYEEEVDGEVLTLLTDEQELRSDFGIAAFGDLKKFRKIQSLQTK